MKRSLILRVYVQSLGFGGSWTWSVRVCPRGKLRAVASIMPGFTDTMETKSAAMEHCATTLGDLGLPVPRWLRRKAKGAT